LKNIIWLQVKRTILTGVLGILLLFGAGCEGDSTADGGKTDGAATDGGKDGSTGDGGTWNAASEFTAVEVGPEASATLQLAVQACAGLYNRRLGGSIYIKMEANDEQWLDELDLEPKNVVNALDFLDACVARFPACVRYSYLDQQKLLPNILTVAAALDAVPLDVGLTVACGDAAFDATLEFKEKNTPYLATKYVFENYVEQTTGLAMLNPGYNLNDSNLSDPGLTRDMSSALVDFVFSQKLFVVFLVNGCRDSNPEKELLSAIVNAGHWPTPLGVYGYNNSWMVLGGYLYEAQTQCLDSRNMGAIASETGNLSFFSTRRAPILDAKELEHNELEDVEYDPGRTYVAFVIGDGDNVQYIMSTRKNWLRQRLTDCGQAGHSCAPITWSISPHLARLAPDVLDWYYKSSHRTGRDYFILPPSGHLYAYPTSLNEKDQDRFVSATEQDARVLGVNGTVHWDWMDTWEDAEKYFLPKYARAEGVIRGVFPVNVPYMFDPFPSWPSDQFFKVLVGKDRSKAVVFRQREWRGVNDDSNVFFLSPQKMAEELGGYPPGTVTWVYMTSDGGLSLDNSFNELVRILPSHVQLVSTDTASRLALTAGRK
jgi:hypothetical protein